MADESKIFQTETDTEEEKSSFDFAALYRIVVLNWQWFLVSFVVCVLAAFIYLRYATPVYNVAAKLYIKTEESHSSARSAYSSLQDLSSLGNVSFLGIDNELEIITSSNIAAQAVRDLKLYTSYWMKGNIKGHELYKDQPLTIDMDPTHLEKLNAPVTMEITFKDNKYHVEGEYWVPVDEIYADGPYLIDKTISKLPATIKTNAGIITIDENPSTFKEPLEEGGTMMVTIMSPRDMSYAYVEALSTNLTTKTSTVVELSINSTNIQRGRDYLEQLVICYNKQANDEKNEISMRTEKFINDRLSKISEELGSTEGELESFKRSNQLTTLNINASASVQGATNYEQKLAEANTQISLINSLMEVVNDVEGQYDVLPVNIGITDNTSTSLINTYNQVALERNQLLRTASENNPTVKPLTAQLEELRGSIRQALLQAKRVAEIQRQSTESQLSQYTSDISKTPQQERVLTQIGREQEIKSDLYLTLLQKREDNSINLAATSEKGRMIESPWYAGKVSPKGKLIMLAAAIIGLGLPLAVFYLLRYFRFRIEDHDEVAKLTSLPIIADIAVANSETKTRGDIVVHENQNNTMEEVFRSMRTNLQFMLKGGDKTIMFTSSISGEGKTFCAANLAISLALLGKKVIMVGLDIRKPRLAELFEIHNHHKGITNLLVMDKPEWVDIQGQIVPSEVNGNLDLLMAGPVPPNPAEIVCRESLDIVINTLKEHYDYIIMDTAPVGIVADTIQIGRVASATVYVCRADYTPRRCLSQLNEMVKEKKLPNVSVVVNGIDMSQRKHRYNYGYGYYGKLGAYYGKYTYSSYGHYSHSHYGNADDKSIKK